ncbi:B3 domain-containing protein REM10 isoform X1 [Nicotiana tabacum]|uniref:B3 domain-containing protein REM10 isoform X1 n=2 Tax=Nicotiana tabacum TaxID=4097 RepID=A0A1S3ZYK9_TOBAC|nr:B3 domain-containing protein REM17-like isoform X7 [Nicotiana tomentosiformis]XP_016469438.1 PREDICTED: B3 domain-containing protein REM17-like isoform X1 [Nicotiana tabacum]
MKVRPVKPHFFKPIQPGFKHALKIPKGFLKYLNGRKHEHAVLRRADKKWLVKVNGYRFEEGWAEFVEENDLQLGDMLVFRHEGNMKFEVIIFDSSHCDREYAEYLQEEEAATPTAHTFGETSKNFEFKDTNNYASIPSGDRLYGSLPSMSCHLSHSGNTDDVIEIPSPDINSSDEDSSHAEAATDKHVGHSHFICTIRPYCLTCGYLRLPQQFANGLSNKKCDLFIRDERQRLWNLKLSSDCKDRVYIGDGWRKFIADNCLKVGERIMFEVVSDGKTESTWKFHVTDAETPKQKFQDLRANASLHPEGKKPDLDANRYSTQGLRIETSDMTAPKAQVPASTSANNAYPHFISTIKPYSIKRPRLYLQADFAKSNGLMNRRCEMIITDEKQRSWSVQLGPTGHHVAITRGWTKFVKANDVQVGDTFKFELINNGTIPIAYFHCKYSGKDTKQSH